MEKSLHELIINNENDRLIEGYASVEILDRQNDIVPIDTMTKAMIEYMKRGGLIMYGHQNKPIGRVIQWNVEEAPNYSTPALKIVALINTGFQLDDQVWDLIKKKELNGFSIGGNATKLGKAQMKDNSTARVLEEIELSEISVVTEPANQGAIISSISVAKSIDEVAIAKALMVDKTNYPWKSCIIDQTIKYNDARIARNICGAIRSEFGKEVMKEEPETFYLDMAINYGKGAVNNEYMEEYPFAKCVYHFIGEGYSFDDAQHTCNLIKWNQFTKGLLDYDFEKLKSKMPTDFKNSCVKSAEASGVPSDKSGNICELIYRKYLKGNKDEAAKYREGLENGSIPFPIEIYNREYYLYKPDYYWDTTVRGHRPPEFYWKSCTAAASRIDFVNSVPNGVNKICGFLFYHKFGGKDGVANEWATSANISYDDMKKWYEHHKVHVKDDAGMPFPEVSDDVLLSVYTRELPPDNWYDKMINTYAVDGAKAVLLYYTNKSKIEKSEKVTLADIPESVLWLYENSDIFRKSVDGVVEVSKPFAGYKNFAACERANHKKYGKEGSKRICGYLKNKTEKGGSIIDSTMKALVSSQDIDGEVLCPVCVTKVGGIFEAAYHMVDEHPDYVPELKQGKIDR